MFTEAKVLVAPEDAQNLINFRALQEQRATTGVKVPDLQAPYLHLVRPDQQTANAMNYDHSKKRIFFSTVEEVDCAVSEANRIKKVINRHNLSFQEWYTGLANKTIELTQRRNTQTR